MFSDDLKEKQTSKNGHQRTSIINFGFLGQLGPQKKTGRPLAQK